MINHIRTLLMNRAGETGFLTGSPCEEFIPPDYRAKPLPRVLQLPMQTLFGMAPDRLFLNYRLRQVMSLLHSTELADHILALDGRIAYLPFVDDLFAEVFGTIVSPVGGHTYALFLTGSHAADEAAGKCLQEWRLCALPANQVEITHVTTGNVTIITYTVANALSSDIPLPESALVARLAVVPTGTTWEIRSAARPALDFGQILTNLEQVVGYGALAWLFQPPLTEPFITFKNLWYEHSQAPYRFGALLLALAYKIDEIRVTD